MRVSSNWSGCAVCGLDLPDYVGTATRLGTRIGHAITRRSRWHKRALAVWRIENGRDPLTGRLDPALAYNPWVMPDADILGDLQRAAQAARVIPRSPGGDLARFRDLVETPPSWEPHA